VAAFQGIDTGIIKIRKSHYVLRIKATAEQSFAVAVCSISRIILNEDKNRMTYHHQLGKAYDYP